MPNITITARFEGEAKTTNIFSIENAPQGVVEQLVGLVKDALVVDTKPPINTQIVVNIDGADVINESKALTVSETAAAELKLIEALKTFVVSHSA